MKLWMMAAILFCGAGCITSCNGNADAGKTAEDTVATVDVKELARLAAIDKFLTDSLGKMYSQGDVCIPCAQIVGTEEMGADMVMVWGDFWVFNYKISGDTLKTVSGGSHPGMMSLQKLHNDYLVIGFDQVEDGSKNLESAKRIFGDRFDAFQAMNSDEKKREEVRARLIADYVASHNLPVKYYQDYGWPVQEIPAE